MCGRYHDGEATANYWAWLFEFVYGEDWKQRMEQQRHEPRYNIAPTDQARIVRQVDGELEIVQHRWGLLPFWAKDRKFAYKTINARSETAHEKPAFQSAFRERRCLVIATGYYEWKKTGRQKQPFNIMLTAERPMLFYGLWESWSGARHAPLDAPLNTFTILTTEANPLTSSIHDRMPCIAAPDDAEVWLETEFQGIDHLRSLLKPYPAERMQVTEVSDYVNNVKHEGAQCIQPV